MSFLKQEFIGLRVLVKVASDPSLTGQEGTIVDETRNMFLIASGGKERWVLKDGSLFQFQGPKEIEVRGEDISYRPEERIRRAR